MVDERRHYAGLSLTTPSDLLRRHERSAHKIDTTRRKRTSVYSNGDVEPTASSSDTRRESSIRESISKSSALKASYSLEPDVSPGTTGAHVHAASDPAFLGNSNSLAVGQSNGHASHFDGFQLSNQAYAMETMGSGEPFTDPFDLFGDGDAFLENVDFSYARQPQDYVWSRS